MIAVTINTRDEVTPILNQVAVGVTPAQVNPVIGRAARNVFVNHLRKQNDEKPNQLGGRRTNYYLGAARGTQFRVVPEGVVISINQVGIALRYFGGVVKPKTAKFLTIPVNPAAHGKRASEFDLEIVFGAGGKPIALATKSSARVSITESKNGRVVKKNSGRRFGEIMFLLAKSVTQKADPTVLPPVADVYAGILPNLRSYVQGIIDRRNAPKTEGTSS